MNTILAVQYQSLDGVMQSPGRPDEDTRGGFDRGGWASAMLADDPAAAEAAMQGQGDTTGLLFGRRTYGDLVGHWLGTDEPNPFTEIIAATPKYVVTRDDDFVAVHPNSTVLLGDAVQTVGDLKAAGDGEIVVLGSAELLHALAAADLVDRYLISTFPLVLGSGARLFAGATPELRVASSFTSPTGIVVATYDVVRRGSAAV